MTHAAAPWTVQAETLWVWPLAALLVAVIYFDLRIMRLPNLLSLLMLALFVAGVAWTLPWGALAWRVVIAGLVLVAGMAANAAGWLGGGDVKVLSALLLFIPVGALLPFAFVFCLAMIGGILLVLALRRAGGLPGWVGLQPSGRYPMGVSIGAAGLIFLLA